MNTLYLETTGRRDVFPEVQRTRPSSAAFVDQTDVLHRQVRDLHENSASLRRSALVKDLASRQQEIAARDGVEMLQTLGESGFAWRDIARIVGVSVPAVQKWRRGEGMTGARRLALAKIVALVEVLTSHMVSDPASWLEMPVKEGVAVSRLELLARNKFDLVLLLIADDTAPLIEVDRILDEYDSTWRTSLIDDQFESFIASDGSVSIRMAN